MNSEKNTDKHNASPKALSQSQTGLPKFIKLSITLVCIGLVVWSLFAAAPRGVDMSIDKIGQGTPALVFVYDPNLAVSIEQVAEINILRDQAKADNLHFIVAKIGYPDAEALVAKHNASSPDLLFFNANGDLVRRTTALVKASTLDTLITESFPSL